MTRRSTGVAGAEAVRSVLDRRRPARPVFAPNLWQWFAHHRNHGTLPAELAGCRTQLDVIRHLGLDVFSRNVYCDERRYWFGGLCDEVWDGVTVTEETAMDGRDTVRVRRYDTPRGPLEERLRYVFGESTLVQERFAIADTDVEFDALETLLASRRWIFSKERYEREQARVAEDGAVVAGELFSPLKALHLLCGAVNTTYLVEDHGDRVREMLKPFEDAQVDLARQMAAAGVPAVMAMDNLDAVFHTPSYVERFSASFYERAARVCHEHGSAFLIHACGRQKANLRLIDSLGVDGLEGVAYPPLGDVELDEAFRLTGDRFLITGGISANETRRLRTRDEIFAYVRNLYRRLEPFAHRFMLSASCNTAIDTPWETIVHFRDAWRDMW